jgi:hypothetical protein
VDFLLEYLSSNGIITGIKFLTYGERDSVYSSIANIDMLKAAV